MYNSVATAFISFHLVSFYIIQLKHGTVSYHVKGTEPGKAQNQATFIDAGSIGQGSVYQVQDVKNPPKNNVMYYYKQTKPNNAFASVSFSFSTYFSRHTNHGAIVQFDRSHLNGQGP
jgi:hypothetical protein